MLADREGFEPSLGLHLNTLSKRAPSATRPPVHPAARVMAVAETGRNLQTVQRALRKRPSIIELGLRARTRI